MRSAFAPVKICPVDQPKAAVRRLFDQLGGAKRAAIRLGKSLSSTYSYADAGEPTELTFGQAAALTSPTAPALAEYLAMLADGVFVPLTCEPADTQALTATSAKESGEAIASIVTALSDGRVSAEEARRALPELDDALRALCGLRSMLLAATGARPANVKEAAE